MTQKNLNIALILVVVVLAFLYNRSLKDNKVLFKNLVGKTEQAKKLTKEVLLLENRYVSQEELQKKAKVEFNSVMKLLNSTLKELTQTNLAIKEKATKQGKSTIIVEGEDGFSANEVSFKDGPPVGYVLNYNDGEVISKLYDFEIILDSITTKDEKSGRYKIATKANYVLKSLSLANQKWLNKKYPLNVSNGVSYIDPTERIKSRNRLYLLNPKFNIGINLVDKDIVPTLGVSVASYGPSKEESSLKILNFSAFLRQDDSLGLLIHPVLFRLAPKTFPNTFVGPSLHFDNSSVNFSLGVQVGL